MTNITYRRFNNSYSITIDGHAGYAETGKDIVCAAISALAQTLMAHIETEAEVCETYVGDGQVWIYGSGLISCFSYETIVTGLKLIAQGFPDYVKIKKGVLCKENPFC